MATISHQLWKGLADEGMYEVIEHEATMELQDVKEKKVEIRRGQRD